MRFLVSRKARNFNGLTLARELIFRSVVNPVGCWIWQGAKSQGYGYLNWEGRAQRAHRLSYRCFIGPLKPSEVVRHQCDNPSCICPDHILKGSHADNVADKILRGRQVAPPVRKGESHPMRKLTTKDVRMIRKLKADGWHISYIAFKFSISEGHTYAILRGKNWKE